MLSMVNSASMDFGLTSKPKTRGAPQRSVSSAIPQDNASSVARAAVAFEYASLRHRSHCPLGMYIVPSNESVMVWDAIFFVHRGYYADAVLKFRLTFPANYPEQPPSVQFITDIFHPLISTDGFFNLAPRFRPWRPKEHHAFDVLHWIKAAFKREALDKLKDHDCLNKEAFRYHDATQTFANLASQSSQLSQSHAALFQKDYPSMNAKPSHGIQLRELKPEQLIEGRSKLGLKEWEEEDDS